MRLLGTVFPLLAMCLHGLHYCNGNWRLRCSKFECFGVSCAPFGHPWKIFIRHCSSMSNSTRWAAFFFGASNYKICCKTAKNTRGVSFSLTPIPNGSPQSASSFRLFDNSCPLLLVELLKLRYLHCPIGSLLATFTGSTRCIVAGCVEGEWPQGKWR